MRIRLFPGSPISRHSARGDRREQGTAVIVVIALLAIVLVYLAGNIRTLYSLGRDLKLLEKRQTRRLEAMGRAARVSASTNATPAASPPSTPSSILPKPPP